MNVASRERERHNNATDGNKAQNSYTKSAYPAPLTHSGVDKAMNFSRPQLTSLVILRLLIGWHFLYEGVTKLFNPYWTAKSYLLTSEGFLQPFFVWLSEEPTIGIVNMANMLLLIGVGLALMLGVLTRLAVIGGIVLLLLYYLAHPPLHGMSMGPGSGNYWIVNYNLIEIAALLVIYFFPTSRYFGLDALRSSTPPETIDGETHD